MAQPSASQTTLYVSLAPSDPPRLMPVLDNLFSFGPPELKSSVLQPLSSSPSPKSSLYLAVKVRSLVNAFRKRANRRSQTARRRADDASFCRDIEREAYLEIDRYLGRKSRHHNGGKFSEGGKKVVGVQDGVTRVGAASACERPNARRSLKNIERAAGLRARTLTTLATSNKHFLLRKTEFSVKRLNIKELQQLIVDVKDLLDTTSTVTLDSSACTHPFSYASTQLLDLTHIANLHHLLLCLLSQLLGQLIHFCIELVRDHVAECQKLRKRWREDWFFEFPDGRPPLSTTWPWAIKPSLAVLWGVCWMFFGPFFWDNEGNLLDSQGNIQISRRELDLWRLSDQASMNNRSPQQQQTPQHSVANTHNISNHMLSAGTVLYRHSAAYPPAQLSAPAYQRPPRAATRDGPANAKMATTQPQTRTQVTQPRQSSSRIPSALLGQNQAPASYPSLAQQITNTAYAAPPATAHADPVVADGSWLPQDTNFHPYFQQQDTWQWQRQNHTSQGPHQYPQQPAHTRGNANLAVQTQSLPPRSPSTGQALTPTIRVTTERPYTPESQAQPQDSHHTSATSQNAPYTYANPTFIDHDLYYSDANYGNMSTEVQIQGPTPQVAQVAQMAPQGGIASPISENTALSRPLSPSNVPMDPIIRKRSFSEMSQQPPPPPMHMMPAEHQSPQASAYETSPGGMEDSGHKVQRMIKRGDPPQAHDGKYYCNYSPDCADQYFDRKCEWSKHMDKHDRPYRCPQAQCAKLQGFTYSGGLLRHEREVHGKHGGPKEQLRCTVSDCKRHAGKGFTRKENLNEHLRRVHGITTTTSDASQLRQIAADAAPGAEMMETPASRFSDTADVDDFTTVTTAYPDLANTKRRRLDIGASPRSGPDDLEIELQRLKADNLEKDERIRRMEENDAAREARMKSLEDKLAQLAQGTPQTLQQVISEQANMGTYPDFNGSAAEVVMQQVHGPGP